MAKCANPMLCVECNWPLEPCRKSREKIEFEILWYSGGPEHAPNRVIARDIVKRYDLTDAITAACNMLKSNKGKHDGLAHGFYVRRKPEDS